MNTNRPDIKKVLLKMVVMNDGICDLKADPTEDDAYEDDLYDEFEDDCEECEDSCAADSKCSSSGGPMKIVTEGYLRKKGNRIELRYAETDETDLADEITVISYEESNPDILTMERNGMCRTALVFEAGRRYICMYNVAGMEMELVVRTYDLENSLTLDGGQLKFGYSLENGGSTVSNVKMTIDVEVL